MPVDVKWREGGPRPRANHLDCAGLGEFEAATRLSGCAAVRVARPFDRRLEELFEFMNRSDVVEQRSVAGEDPLANVLPKIGIDSEPDCFVDVVECGVRQALLHLELAVASGGDPTAHVS